MILFPIILFFFSFSINKIDLENKKIINIKYFGLKTKIIDFSQIQGIKIEYEHAFKGNFKQSILNLVIDSNEAISFSSLEITNFDDYLETLPNYFKFLRSENYDLTFYRYFELTDDEKKQLFKELENEERSLILERLFHYSIFILLIGYIAYEILLNNNVDSSEFTLNQLKVIPIGALLIYGIKRIIYYIKSLINEDTYMYKFLRKNI